MFEPKQSFTYDDIGLVPRSKSTIASREKDTDPSTCFLGYKLKLPILMAPMEKVVGFNMSKEVRRLGGLAFLPRTKNLEEDLSLYKQLKNKAIPSIPATGDFLERFIELRALGATHFCIDVANGFHENIEEAVKLIKEINEDSYLITGNVASVEGYEFLSNIGIDAVRVGIGNGGTCLTSVATGIGVGQSSLIREITQSNQFPLGPLLIADGGIKTSGDIVKSIALGADIVMTGGMFAGTEESPGDVVIHEGKKYKHLAGQASRNVKRSQKFVEGADLLVPYRGKLEKMWDAVDQGIRSGMAYMNCRTIRELKMLPDNNFVFLSNSAKAERKVHAGNR